MILNLSELNDYGLKAHRLVLERLNRFTTIDSGQDDSDNMNTKALHQLKPQNIHNNHTHATLTQSNYYRATITKKVRSPWIQIAHKKQKIKSLH